MHAGFTGLISLHTTSSNLHERVDERVGECFDERVDECVEAPPGCTVHRLGVVDGHEPADGGCETLTMGGAWVSLASLVGDPLHDKIRYTTPPDKKNSDKEGAGSRAAL